ncbi:hypothetical protein NLI96_g4133 [Meripilus lineatus]|uniref:Uncharacterized protein n=1 Tax=Meripilus lineatus TaxID=2056292 RepID=A0AAD5V7I4_9APHY|nr:hypothetical protein NLI96_g4133 [Physisporinus lineatus]
MVFSRIRVVDIGSTLRWTLGRREVFFGYAVSVTETWVQSIPTTEDNALDILRTRPEDTLVSSNIKLRRGIKRIFGMRGFFCPEDCTTPRLVEPDVALTLTVSGYQPGSMRLSPSNGLPLYCQPPPSSLLLDSDATTSRSTRFLHLHYHFYGGYGTNSNGIIPSSPRDLIKKPRKTCLRSYS